MNPISKVTGAITHPLRTATTVAGGAMGVAAAGVRTATRIVSRGNEEADAPAAATPAPSAPAPSSGPSAVPSPTLAVKTVLPDAADAGDAETEAPAERAAVTKSPAKKSPAKKAAAKKAPAGATPAKKATAETAPTPKAPTPKKTSAKKSTAKKAPSAQAATAGPAMAPGALAAIDKAIDGDTSHVETETEVVYSSETSSGSRPDHLTEPLIDPAVAAALRSEVEAPEGGDADAQQG